MADAALITSRISLAMEMIKKLDEIVQFTAANRGTALITDSIGLTDHSAAVGRVYNAWTPQNYGDHSPHAAVLANTVSEAHGNCDMKAECVYSMIRNRPSDAVGTNTKIMTCQIPGHTFCMLCSDTITTAPASSYPINHFGEEVVVCDGWQSDYYAPNVWWPYGRIPGIEALVWRKKIASNQILVVKVHSFRLV